MIAECTDCKWCADFENGYRIFCLNPNLPPDEVLKYQPLFDRDASYCKEFYESESFEFIQRDFSEAEDWCDKIYKDVTYKGIREWCEMKIKERKDD